MDRCIDENIFSHEFPDSFSIVQNPTITVTNASQNNIFSIIFVRKLVDVYLQEFTELKKLVSSFTIQPLVLDLIRWRWQASGKFTVQFYT